MQFTITMPKLSPTMEEGTLVKWHIKEGEFVKAGDVLFDVATDKANVEYQALDEGWLRKILVSEGEEAKVNQPVGILTEKKDESFQIPSISTPPEKEEKKEAQILIKEPLPKEEGKRKEEYYTQPKFVPEPPLEDISFGYPTEPLEKRILATPLAKKMALEKGLDLSSIKGSGPNQRITSQDLEKAQPSGIVNFGHREKPLHPAGSYEEQPISPIRKIIGQRLQESKSFIPHFYITQVINADALVSTKDQLKNLDLKISINDLIVRGVALALRQHPKMNSGFNSVNQTIIQFKTVDIAIAVSLEEGLVTPIIRQADFKNLGEISIEARSLAKKAREGKLTPQEYKGGSFTISNLGMYGISEFQAILNPPQSAILAVRAIQDTPIIKEGLVVSGKTMSLTLSVDHRVIDGVTAAVFLQTLKKLFENSAILLIG